MPSKQIHLNITGKGFRFSLGVVNGSDEDYATVGDTLRKLHANGLIHLWGQQNGSQGRFSFVLLQSVIQELQLGTAPMDSRCEALRSWLAVQIKQ